MQNLFLELQSLDARCYSEYSLSEDLLMEHAAEGMNQYIRSHLSLNAKVCIVCGTGNNGADGLALARLLHGDYNIHLILPFGVKSPMAKIQLNRIHALNIPILKELTECDALVDALYGSGLSRDFDTPSKILLEQMNQLDALKIACDIPSGLSLEGTLQEVTFIADVTLSMGALKRCFYSDVAKSHIGKVSVLDLGISRQHYENESKWQLLDETDLELPHRHEENSHKGSYGHLSIICGEKEGAAIISGSSALRFGVGLVTLISNENVSLPYELMQSHLLPETTTAIALGMGLGQEFSQEELMILLDNTYPLILDADIFTNPLFTQLITRDILVMTPHPKEFTQILKVLKLADIDVATLQKQRFKYVERFTRAYPNVVLLLKGANVIIGQAENYYINPHGSNILAKGGSGDVLAGLIGALLAQGQSPLKAAINASLTHTLAAKKVTVSDYALTPNDLIKSVSHL